MQFSQERLDKIAPTSRFRQRTATQNAAEDRQAAGNSGYGGLIVLPDLFSAVNRDLIIALAARYGVPAIYYNRAYAESGGLIAYGDDYAEEFRQAAGYIDRILKGAKASRSASPESEEVRAGHQSQDRQGARPDHPRIFPGARRRGDRVK